MAEPTIVDFRRFEALLIGIPWSVWAGQGYRVEDGMFLRLRGQKVWAPVTKAQCLAAIKKDPKAADYYDAYIAGDFTQASRIYRRIQRKQWNYADLSPVRRSRLKSALGGHTLAEWQAILGKFGHRCAICREKGRLEKDHIIPLCAGGSNYALNLQPLCKSCNSAKSGRIQPGTQFSLFDQVNIRQTQGQAISDRMKRGKRRNLGSRACAYGTTR